MQFRHLNSTLGASLIASSASCLPGTVCGISSATPPWGSDCSPSPAGRIPPGISTYLRPEDPHLSARYRGQTLLCLASGSSLGRSPEPGCVAAFWPQPRLLQRTLVRDERRSTRRRTASHWLAFTKNGPLRTRILPSGSIKETKGSYQFKV